MEKQSLRPELQTFTDDFGTIRSEAEQLVDGLTDAQFNWHPAPERWSLAQVFDHLNVTGYLLLPRLEHAIRRGRAERLLGDKPLRYGWVGNWFVRSMQPGASMRKVKSPALYVPSTRAALDEVMPRFGKLQDQLVHAVEDADGLDLSRINVSSPVSRLLRINVGAWFAATVAHERRHLVQAQAVRDSERFPQD